MQVLAIALGSLVLYLVAYHTYGKWLGRKIFRLDPQRVAPSIELEDGSDYVPTKKGIVFGHHFTSIAGTGPIVGPALAVMWGWLPALLWVLIGSIFIGAVHDFGALVVSMRNQGRTVGDIAGDVISPRVRLLFLLILVITLTIVLAIFGLVISLVFGMFPQAITPCLLQIPLAIIIGYFVHRKGHNILLPSLVALALMYLSVLYGDIGWLADLNAYLKAWPVMTWVSVLLAYSYIASVLPVWILLQPRDYINSLQLISTLALVVIGLVVAACIGGAPIEGYRPQLELAAPAIESHFSAKNLPLIFPFLFVTIACGAVSGFHCLVSSGTSSKQLRCESEARFVGYGSMLTEGFLAVLVILACVAGLGLGLQKGDAILTGSAAWDAQYSDWASSKGLPAKVNAFVTGASNFLQAMGISVGFAKALMAVFVASFAATTLDSACRLQRYVVQELSGCWIDFRHRKLPPPQRATTVKLERQNSWITNKHTCTIAACLLAWWMASLPAIPGAQNVLGRAGSGGFILWPLFGATNQLLGGLAFLVILFWMRRNQLPTWLIILPTLFMLVIPAWAMIHQIFFQAIGAQTSWIEQQRWLLVALGAITIILEIWMITEAILSWNKSRPITQPASAK